MKTNASTRNENTALEFKEVDHIPACMNAVIYDSKESNPLFAVSAEDDRGEFFMLDYSTAPPSIVEIIHTKPDKVRGNHVHEHCNETLTMLSGEIDIYLLCSCEERHLLKKKMVGGASALIFPGVAHAVRSRTTCEFTSVFTKGDPRDDRERVQLIAYP